MKLLFVGDSLIDYFDWQKQFPQHELWQQGIPGETVQGLLGRTERIITQVDAPDYIIIMIGTNNLVLEDFGFTPVYEKIIALFSAAFPEAKRIITSLLPIKVPWLADSAVPRMNQILEALCRQTGSVFFNIYPGFLDTKGLHRPELFTEDGVHLSKEGYALWASALAEQLNL